MTKDRTIVHWLILSAVLWSLGPVSCTSEDLLGEGTFALSVGGGEAVRAGIPYYEGEALYAFVDGWSITFDTYIVIVGDVEITDPETGDVQGQWAGPAAVDLAADTDATVDIATLEGLPATRLDVGFSYLTATASTVNQNVDADDLSLMVDNGWSFMVHGEAEHDDGRLIEFRFGLSIPTQYYECINGVDTTRGIAIEANKTTGAFIYAHAVHLFWDTLATGNEDLRFEAFAAMAGDDLFVTEAEIAEQALRELVDSEGNTLTDPDGHRVVYDDGSLLPRDEKTLLGFVRYAARSGAHFNGVGLCNMRFLDE